MAVQYLGCVIGAWRVAFRDRPTHYFFAFLLVAVDLISLGWWFSEPFPELGTSLVAASALLLVGIAMHREMRRWWLAVELG